MLRTAPVVALCALACLACGEGTAAAPGADRVTAGSGAQMCSVLGAADLAAVGLAPTLSAPAVRVGNGGQSAMCTWTTSPSAAERIEYSLYYPAGDPPAVWTNVLADLEPFATLSRPGLPRVDDQLLGSSVAATIQPDGRAFPWIVVRRGELLLALDVPAGPQAREQLLALASTVLARLPAPAGSPEPLSPPAPGLPDACRAVPVPAVQSALGGPVTAGDAVTLPLVGEAWSDCTFTNGSVSVNVLVAVTASRASAMAGARIMGSNIQVGAADHEVPLPGIGEAAWTGPAAARSCVVFAVQGSRRIDVTASGDPGRDYASIARSVAASAVRGV